ncbi:MAG TPA: MFS transporter [Ktedonobacterales bacterium]
MIATLRQRSFVLLWLAGLISLAGDWVLMIGLPIYVYILTGSVLATAIMLMCAVAPGALVGSLAGVFVDRWDRKRTMVATNVIMALGLLPLLLVRSADHVWIAYIVAVLESVVEQFFTPATSAVLPQLVGEERLVQANSLSSLSSNVARLVGPALGGAVAGFFGLAGIVAADGASFALAALLLAGISRRAIQRTQPVPSPTLEQPPAARRRNPIRAVLAEWADGLRVIAGDRALAVILFTFALTAVGEGVMSVLYPVFVYQVLHGAAPQIGQLMSAQAVGGLIGGLVFGWIGSRVMSRWAIGLCAVVFGAIDLVIFNSPALLPAYGLPVFACEVGLFIAVGIPAVGMSTGAQSLAQARSPESHRGRVFGVAGALMSLMLLGGTLIAGFITTRLGVVPVLNIQGAGYVVAGLLVLALLPRTRKTDMPAAPPADEQRDLVGERAAAG